MKYLMVAIMVVLIGYVAYECGVSDGRDDVASGEFICVKDKGGVLKYECKKALSGLFWSIEH